MKPNTTAWVALGLAVGLAVGLGAYTFVYARGDSYLTNNSAACANCHVMRGHYDGWLKGSHHAVAACNDCHTPHNSVTKYAAKSFNGFMHSLAFSTGWFPDNIRIKPRNARIAENACRNCHQDMLEAIDGRHRAVARNSTACLRCHASVGHMDELGAVATNANF